MEVTTVTLEHVAQALQLGACEVPDVGTPINKISTSYLIWCEEVGIVKRGTLFQYGNGYGNGNGYGYGNGNGYGNEYGKLLSLIWGVSYDKEEN